MIKFFCDRCGSEVSEKNVRSDYEERAANTVIDLYTGEDSDQFIQGLSRTYYKRSFILCDKCMKELRGWIKGEGNEVDD